jgi:hypothetical protein
MMKLKTSIAAAAVLAALAGGGAWADSGQVQFSAQMVRLSPDGKTATGRMYVGEGRTRMEMSQQGREVVRISDSGRRMEWILFPADKTYLERSAPPAPEGAPPPDAPPSAETNPCAAMPQVTCRRVGVEDVNGRPAVKWEMSMTHQGQTLTGTQWLDQERAIPLKHQMPNGQAMELKMLGSETLEGRSVEKWEMTTTAQGQQPTVTFQWYDPQLKLAVRDELPGGYVSELKGIVVAPQPDSLFAVPEGYTRKTPPPDVGPATPPPAQ